MCRLAWCVLVNPHLILVSNLSKHFKGAAAREGLCAWGLLEPHRSRAGHADPFSASTAGMCSLLHPILLLGLSWIPAGILGLWRWSWEVYGEMGPGQCLLCVAVVVSVQERRGQAAALLGRAEL